MSKVGRPTKYTEDMPQKLLDFFNCDLERTVTEEVASQGKAVQVTKTTANRFPTFERFCANERITKQTMLNWTTQYPEFLDAYSIAKQLQKDFLIQHGLTGSYNAGFAKFVGINCTDMKDKVEHEHNTSEIKVVIDSDDEEL